MRVRTLLILATLATTAVSASAGGAGAATLFTTAAHTVRVPVGTIAGVVSGTLKFTTGPSVVEECGSSTLGLTVVQNNHARIIGAITSGSFTSCSPFPAVTPTFSGTSAPWTLTISGAGTSSGPNTTYNATVDGVSIDFGGGNYRGSLENVTAFQPTATGSPLCLELHAAKGLVGPLSGDLRVDATYCFEGAAAAWSLTD
jgi:hypothetical protein